MNYTVALYFESQNTRSNCRCRVDHTMLVNVQDQCCLHCVIEEIMTLEAVSYDGVAIIQTCSADLHFGPQH